jgi:hypothetical protein
LALPKKLVNVQQILHIAYAVGGNYQEQTSTVDVSDASKQEVDKAEKGRKSEKSPFIDT